MLTKRRGVFVGEGASAAKVSSQGSISATPEPMRRFRRLEGRLARSMACSRGSSGLEEIAGGDEGDQVPQPVAALPEPRGDAVEVGTVAEGHGTSQGIGGQLVDHGPGELILPVEEQIALQPID